MLCSSISIQIFAVHVKIRERYTHDLNVKVRFSGIWIIISFWILKCYGFLHMTFGKSNSDLVFRMSSFKSRTSNEPPGHSCCGRLDYILYIYVNNLNDRYTRNWNVYLVVCFYGERSYIQFQKENKLLFHLFANIEPQFLYYNFWKCVMSPL